MAYYGIVIQFKEKGKESGRRFKWYEPFGMSKSNPHDWKDGFEKGLITLIGIQELGNQPSFNKSLFFAKFDLKTFISAYSEMEKLLDPRDLEWREHILLSDKFKPSESISLFGPLLQEAIPVEIELVRTANASDEY